MQHDLVVGQVKMLKINVPPAPLFTEQTSLQNIDELLRSPLSEVTNVDVRRAAWDQAALPVRHGGLGERSVEMLALPCYIASLHAANKLITEV